jgi:thioredoxin 1
MIPGAALEDLVDKVKALDMDDVRKKLAEQEAEAQQEEAKAEEAKAAGK